MACATLKRTLDFDPLHSPGTSPKRRRCSPIIPSTPSSKSSFQPSPFSPVTPRISPGQLAAHISQEWKRLKRRKRLEESFTPSEACSSHEANHPHPHHHHHHLASQMSQMSQMVHHAAGSAFPGLQPGPSVPSTSTALPVTGASPSSQTKDQPMFTLKQVILICERMLKEQESRVREEYDKVLTCKLAEQYDAFVKFNQDQIQRRYSASTMSYVS